MKIIYPETQSTVSSTSEDVSWPDDNVLNDYPKKMWKANGSATGTLTIVTTAAGAAGVGIYNTNAESITITVKDATEATTYYSSGALDLTPASPARTWNRCWYDFTQKTEVLHILIGFTAATGVTVYAGVVKAGPVVTLPDPSYGLSQTREDYSIKQELGSGGMYIHDRDKPRVMDLNFVMLRETEFDDLDEIFEEMGSQPLGMLLAEQVANDLKWCGLFHILSPPSGQHDFPSHSNVSLNLREAV